VGFYRNYILPRLVDWTCSSSGLKPWRDRVCAGLTGSVLEIGFGSGTNIEHYPSSVRHLYAVEPAALSRRLARKRIEASSIPITHVGLDGQAIPLMNSSCDSALCTFTLCTIPDPVKALREVYRILKPGGQLHFLEHGIAPDASIAKWQRRLDGLERRLADGCHLTRGPLALVTAAGFEPLWNEQRYAHGPKPWSYFTVAAARKPTQASDERI
jgi:ubiquinone/menaquinone biosynthesis C-methylase UbiE